MIHLRVLVVAAEHESRQCAITALARDPIFAVRGCATGEDALAVTLEWRPDLALIDETMPDAHGPTVLERMRSDKRTAPTPVVVMTERPECRERLVENGAAGVIAKPIEPTSLPKTIRLLARAEGALSRLREEFLRRLASDAAALTACRTSLAQARAEPAMKRVNQIAHALAGAGGIYGFAGISCESTALAVAAERNLAGRGKPLEVEEALDRLLVRIAPVREVPRYSAATA